MLRVLIYCLLAVVGFRPTTVTFAQTNLVSNGSFEELRPNTNGDTICPISLGQVYLARNWKSADGSIDYFNACSNEDWPNFGMPSNIYGNQVALGSAYAVIGCYSLFYDDAREYLMQELEEPLISGQGYFFRMHISLADSSNFAISGIGALFTIDDTRFWEDPDFFNAIPQVENSADSLLVDKTGWVEIQGHFVASGNEKYLTIGCFNDDQNERIEQVSNHPESTYNWDLSSYYIDGIELYEDNSIGVLESSASEIMIYPNPAERLLRIESNNGVLKNIEILDLRGAVLIQKPAVHKTVTLDISTLLPGIYLLKATTTDAEVFTTRLVKE